MVVAPSTTFDLEAVTGKDIPIELRAPEEVTHVAQTHFATDGIDVLNPAFDVTPAGLISVIITERCHRKSNTCRYKTYIRVSHASESDE